MSLTSQLKTCVRGDMLGDWCQDRLTGTDTLIDEVQAAVVDVPPIRPVGDVDVDHWARIGGAFSQRLQFAVSGEPPYAALLGAASAGLLGYPAIDEIAALFPTHRGMRAATELRPTADGWRQLSHRSDPHPSFWGLTERAQSDDLIRAYAELIVSVLPDPGTIGTDRDQEVQLARACWVLSAYESAHRGGAVPQALLNVHRDVWWVPSRQDPKMTREAVRLLELECHHKESDELVRLLGRFHGGALHTFRELGAVRPGPAGVGTGTALGIASPLFVVNWAEGDLMVGDTLLDVKTVINLRNRDSIRRWLYQLLAYAWLDTSDAYRIRNVGLYLARHGVTITWPIEEFAERIVNVPGCVVPARREFLEEAYFAMDFDGATPFPDDVKVRIA